ncbi:hypothetical protein BKA65DRAFT_36657 [Rhexocercosporidium sp. MPI-PUGE-AT-0058]|nr:hypothetical protein BKA65DRAFT_36657 [Rhexocercosporidium sp. MPI-PUGE-AT-0058]
MHFSTITLLFALAATTLSAPTPPANLAHSVKRALTSQPYNSFSVSSGVGGSALAEVNANFPIGSDLAAVSASDLAIISAAAKVSEQAEVATGGFNDAIAAAGGQGTTEGKALQVGKIKNKVLKLQTDVLRLQIQAAQGKTGLDAQIAQQQKKLAANVALDVAAKGQTAKAINFAG